MDREKLKADILRYLDSDMTAEEERALAAAIKGNREAEDLFAELMRFNGNIATVLSEAAGEKDAKRELARSTRTRSGARRGMSAGGPSPLTWILVAAGVAAAALIVVLGSGPDEPVRKAKPAPVAKKEEPRELPPPPPLPPPEKKVTPPEPLPPPAPAPKPEKPPTPKLEVPAPTPEPPKPLPPPPPPPPSPAPPPEAKPVPPPTTKAVLAVATLEGVKGDVTVKKEPAKEGQSIQPDQAIETGTGEAAAVLKFTDGTKLDLSAETRIDRITNGEGKKISLLQGVLGADVKKQPAGQPLVVTTPHAEARVIGTKFTLTVKGDSTRLDVQEGRVRLTRLSDGAFADVVAGYFTVAMVGPRPVAKKIATANPRLLLNEDFETAAGVDARWQLLSDGFPTTARGKLDIDVSPRAGASYAMGGWHLPGGARIKQGFPLPFRLSVDVEVTAKHDDLNALVALVPASAKAGVIKNELTVRLRGAEYGILVENNKGKTSSAGGSFPLRSRWVVELDRQEIRFWADGKEIGRQAHGLTISEDYKIELHGGAKEKVPAGSRVIFDNVKVEPLER